LNAARKNRLTNETGFEAAQLETIQQDTAAVRPVNPRYEMYLSGWARGFEARQSEIDRLTWEAGLWYFCANNRGKRPSDYYASVTSDLWTEASR
jgi:hypothetical protein